LNIFLDKSALITGGSSGIGLAIARRIVMKGGNVTLLARRADVLSSAVESLSQSRLLENQRILSIQADVTQKSALEKSLVDFINSNGLPDFVFNCAGVAHPGRFEELPDEIYHWMMDVDFFGTVNVLKVLVPLMQQRKSGVIVNMSSIAGFIGIYGYSAYGAAKFAISGLSDTLRAELKPDGIQLSVVFPPDTDTPQLAYESQFKPAVTRELSGSAKKMSPDQVASEILRGVEKKQYVILPGSEGKMMYFLHHFAGRLIYPLMDVLVASALKKNSQSR